jgi:hypothetical protein
MNDQHNPTTEMANAVERLGLDRAPQRDRALAIGGQITFVLGPVLCLVAFFVSRNTTDPLQQNDMQILAMFGISLTILGGLLLLRYSVVTYFRFWAARVVAEISSASNADPGE